MVYRGRKAVAFGGKGIDAIRMVEETAPAPDNGEILVRMRAATLNYRDLIGVRGQLPGMTKEPDYVPLSCACGEVVAVGAGVERVSVGDRVAPIFDQKWFAGGRDQISFQQLGGSRDGVARDYAIFDQQSVVRAPDELTDLEVATLPCAGITAWSALFDGIRRMIPGDIVLLQGTGGVSIAALQMAKAAGCTVIITSSSDAKLARARMLGADITINYIRTPDWGTAAQQLTHGRGVDLVVDVVGASQIEQTIAALRQKGSISGVGMLEGEFLWNKEQPVAFAPITVGSRDTFEAMNRGLVAAHVRPVVDRVFPLERLQSAMETMAAGDFFGKIAITFD